MNIYEKDFFDEKQGKVCISIACGRFVLRMIATWDEANSFDYRHFVENIGPPHFRQGSAFLFHIKNPNASKLFF